MVLKKENDNFNIYLHNVNSFGNIYINCVAVIRTCNSFKNYDIQGIYN